MSRKVEFGLSSTARMLLNWTKPELSPNPTMVAVGGSVTTVADSSERQRVVGELDDAVVAHKRTRVCALLESLAHFGRWVSVVVDRQRSRSLPDEVDHVHRTVVGVDRQDWPEDLLLHQGAVLVRLQQQSWREKLVRDVDLAELADDLVLMAFQEVVCSLGVRLSQPSFYFMCQSAIVLVSLRISTKLSSDLVLQFSHKGVQDLPVDKNVVRGEADLSAVTELA